MLTLEELNNLTLEELYELQRKAQFKYWNWRFRRNRHHHGRYLGIINATIRKKVLQPPWIPGIKR